MTKDNVREMFPTEKDPEVDVDYRDAGTGQFVTEQYAEANPGTTVSETADLEPAKDAEEPEYNSILKVWRAMLDPTQQQRHIAPTPDWCAILIAKWPFLRFAECGVVQREYFKIFDEMYEIVEQVYRDNPENFDIDDREKDVEENKDLYVHLLKEFQKSLFVTQSEWSHDDPEAGAKMAALGEAQQQILGKDGLASYLGVIGLPYTEDEQNAMNQELQEFRESLEVR